jgi:hypothetical protein
VTGVVAAVVVEGVETGTDRQAFQVRSRRFREASLTAVAAESEIRQRRLDTGTRQVKTVLFAPRISLSSLELSDPADRLMVKAPGM